MFDGISRVSGSHGIISIDTQIHSSCPLAHLRPRKCNRITEVMFRKGAPDESFSGDDRYVDGVGV
jgi:hypothetical protein